MSPPASGFFCWPPPPGFGAGAKIRTRPQARAAALAAGGGRHRPAGSAPGPSARRARRPGRRAAGVGPDGERHEDDGLGAELGRQRPGGPSLLASAKSLSSSGAQPRAADALGARRQHAALDDVAAAVDDVAGARADLDLAVADDLLRRVGDGPDLLLIEGDLIGDRVAGLAEGSSRSLRWGSAREAEDGVDRHDGVGGGQERGEEGEALESHGDGRSNVNECMIWKAKMVLNGYMSWKQRRVVQNEV